MPTLQDLIDNDTMSDWKPGDAAVFLATGSRIMCRIINTELTPSGRFRVKALYPSSDPYRTAVLVERLRRPTPAEEAEIDRLLPRSQDA